MPSTQDSKKRHCQEDPGTMDLLMLCGILHCICNDSLCFLKAEHCIRSSNSQDGYGHKGAPGPFQPAREPSIWLYQDLPFTTNSMEVDDGLIMTGSKDETGCFLLADDKAPLLSKQPSAPSPPFQDGDGDTGPPDYGTSTAPEEDALPSGEKPTSDLKPRKHPPRDRGSSKPDASESTDFQPLGTSGEAQRETTLPPRENESRFPDPHSHDPQPTLPGDAFPEPGGSRQRPSLLHRLLNASPLFELKERAKQRTRGTISKTESPKSRPEVETDALVRANMDSAGYTNGSRGPVSSQDSDHESKGEDGEESHFFVYYLSLFATIGGLLFGYDTGIISGAMLLIEDYFDLSTIWKEIIVSGTVGAAAVFALFAGFTCDVLGRKVTIMMASVVFTGGAIMMATSNTKEELLGGRIVVGIGIGFASMTVPVYVAEAAPPGIRGRLVTLNQLFITIGILISSIVAGAFSSMKTTGWRYMLGLAGLPGIVQFIGFFFLPESPRWLVTKGKLDKAVAVLQRIRQKTDVTDEIEEIKASVEKDKKQAGFVVGKVFKTPHVRRALFVGCGLQTFQQLCGINTVIYYSATILRMAGFPPSSAIWLVLVPNSINFLATFIGVWLVERTGRKKLLAGSFVGVVIALAVLATGFQLSANFSPDIDKNVTETFNNGSVLKDDCYTGGYSSCESCIEHRDCGFCYVGDSLQGTCVRADEDFEDKRSENGRCNRTNLELLDTSWAYGYCPTDFNWMAVFGLALFVLGFAPGLGPMPWTINAEIYPLWARSTCNSIATGFNWGCNLLVSLFFLTLTEAITKYGAFWLFGCICFMGLIFTLVFVPETKNKTLEEVELLFKGTTPGADNPAYTEGEKKDSGIL